MTLVVQRLRSQLPDGVLAFGAEQPRLSWQVSASHPELVQLGYEIEASESPGFESVLATTDQRDGDENFLGPAQLVPAKRVVDRAHGFSPLQAELIVVVGRLAAT